MLNYTSRIIMLILVSLSLEFSFMVSSAKARTNSSELNKSIETTNFKIIYNENSSKVAHLLALNIERWGDEVYNFLKQKPNFKITVFINNNVDLVNSFSAFTIVSLYLNNNSYSYNEFGNNWLENTFKHELAHNVTRLYDYNFWGGKVFSKMRETFIPTWMHEGSSVLTESKTSTEGRFYNPTFWSKERFLINSNLNYYFFYYNEDPYLDGSSFLNFYYKKYGEEKTILSHGDYSSRSVFKLLNSPITYFAKNVHKSNDELLIEWQNSLKNKYINNNDTKTSYIEGDEVKLSNYIITDLLGENQKGQLVFSANKKNIFTNKYEKYVVMMNSNNEIIKSKKLDNNEITSFAYNIVDDSITYTKLNSNSFTGSITNKAYSTKMGLFSGTEKFDTDRTYKLVKAENDTYYYLKVDNEKVALLDNNNNILIDYSENKNIEHLRYEANMDILYFVSGKIGETNKYIYFYDIKAKELKKIVEGVDPYIKGSNLYFSYAKSPDGIFNIYKYSLQTKKIEQITDTKYGASNPIVIGNNLYYTSYSTNKDNLVISSIFKLKLDPYNVNQVVMYDEYNIDKVYNNGYVEKHSDEYLSTETNINSISKEVNNNYYDLIFMPSVYTDFSSLKLDFLLGTGKHTLSFGLSEGSSFISFSKDNFTTLLMFNEQPLYTFSYFGKRDNSTNVGIFDFNPILINGYGYLPTLRLDTEINSLGGNSIGASLIGDYSYLSYSFNKPKTEDTKSFGYNEINASYSIFSIKALQVEGNGEISYGINPFDEESKDYIWQKSEINNLYLVTMDIPFTFYIYKGTKTGSFGYKTLTVSPKFSYIYANDNLGNYAKGGIVALSFKNDIRLIYNMNLGLEATIYTSQRDSFNERTKNSGVFFSVKM